MSTAAEIICQRIAERYFGRKCATCGVFITAGELYAFEISKPNTVWHTLKCAMPRTDSSPAILCYCVGCELAVTVEHGTISVVGVGTYHDGCEPRDCD